jgi:hypothetical protein
MQGRLSATAPTDQEGTKAMHALWKSLQVVLLVAICLCSNALALLLALPQWMRGRFAFRIAHGCMWLSCPGLSHGARTLGPNVIQVRELNNLTIGLMVHELVHCEQAQAASLLGAATSAVIWAEGRPWWGLLLPVTLAWLASAGAAYVVAWLRGEPTYRGAHIEEAANHAQAGVHPHQTAE